MLRGTGRFAVAIAAAAAWAMSIPSCAAVLGIEEIQPGVDGGPSGSGGAAGSSAGGASVGGGSGSGGGSTGTAGNAGGVGGSAGSAMGGSGGQLVTDAGDARPPLDAADGGALAITVQGKVIDSWRHPYPQALVMIGNAVVTTDANGTFVIPNVKPPYDVTTIVDTTMFTEAWAFIGLTRPNPTLQFDGDSYPLHYATALNATVTAISDTAVFSWGSPDGIFNTKLAGSGFQNETPGWSGPVQSAGNAYALEWTTLVDGRPSTYTAFDQKPAVIAAGGSLTLAMNLTNTTIATDTVSGTVTLGELTPPIVDAWVTFPGGGAIAVASQTPPLNAFSYVVPRLANTTITLVEVAGDPSYFPQGLVHKRALAANLVGVTLAVPDPAHLALPRAAGTASTSTEFSWTGPDTTYVMGFFVVGTGTRYRVVTKEKNGANFVGRLPRLPPNSGIDLAVGMTVNWWAEIQGTYASVDEATGPQGFVDSFDTFTDSTLHSSTVVIGPNDRDGFRVTSEIRSFTSIAP